MKNMKYAKYLLILLALLAIATPMLAQAPGGGTTERKSTDWVAITSGFSMAIASGLCALGQGKAIAGAAEGMARNPAASAGIRFALILGLILIESLALYTFAIIFVKVVP
jgi:F-type H+-transporting ATPase subunit c